MGVVDLSLLGFTSFLGNVQGYFPPLGRMFDVRHGGVLVKHIIGFFPNKISLTYLFNDRRLLMTLKQLCCWTSQEQV